MTLINSTKQNEIVSNLATAETFFARLQGLLGRTELGRDEALWISRTNSVHTWFMNFPIDVVFIDSNLVVRKCFENLKPWRLTWPVWPFWQSHSVIELPAGIIAEKKIEEGDQLNVLH